MARYTLDVAGADFTIYSETGHPLRPVEMDNLLAQLRITPPKERKKPLLPNPLPPLHEVADRADWVFLQNGRSRSRNTGDCVYFVQSPSKPGLLKVGYSYNAFKRLHQIRAQFGATSLVLAYAKSQECILLETLIHQELQIYQDGRTEWYSREAVEQFLDQYRDIA